MVCVLMNGGVEELLFCNNFEQLCAETKRWTPVTNAFDTGNSAD